MQFGLLGMLMHGAALGNPHWLREFSAYQAFQFFNIDASGAAKLLAGLAVGLHGQCVLCYRHRTHFCC